VITTESLFPEPKKLETCSFNECSAGHKWPIAIAIGRCPACNQPVLAIKMVNCPQCNEPTLRSVLRTDHMPHGAPMNAACRGDAMIAEVGQIELIRHHAEAAQAEYEDREMIGKI